FTTPGGTPAASMHSISATAHIEVVGAGTQTIALPAARPAPRYSTGILIGKFHGVTTAYTPRGWRMVKTSLLLVSTGITLVSSHLICSPASRKPAIAALTSPSASLQ